MNIQRTSPVHFSGVIMTKEKTEEGSYRLDFQIGSDDLVTKGIQYNDQIELSQTADRLSAMCLDDVYQLDGDDLKKALLSLVLDSAMSHEEKLEACNFIKTVFELGRSFIPQKLVSSSVVQLGYSTSALTLST